MEQCPCGSGKAYGECCQMYHAGKSSPETAESCMRARYSAFAKSELNYLKDTYDPSKISEFDLDSTKQWAEDSEWRGLEVVRSEDGSATDDSGLVEFIATYANGGSEYKHHEVADFQKIDGRWYFINGNVQNNSIKRSAPKVGRNDPCSCGSGKKYKKCCL